MGGTTIKEFAAKLAESTNATFKKNNPQLFGASVGDSPKSSNHKASPNAARDNAVTKQPTGTAKSPEEKLNKTERRFLAVLRTRYPKPGIQNITFRLGEDLRYTPDLNSGQLPLVFFETKGPHRFRERGILKARWAAKEYPYFDFYLVTWDKDRGWQEELIPKQ